MPRRRDSSASFDAFHPAVREWFTSSFAAPTAPQTLGWPAIARGESTLILAPTGSGKTLSAFLWALNRLMFSPIPPKRARCRVLYVSPLKALAVDVERNLRAPLAGIARIAAAHAETHVIPVVGVRTGDTPAAERARFQREPVDILITTPESLYLLLTSNAREALRSIETVIVDEIHALVPTKRGVHLALSLERLETLCDRALQRIGLSATQRPLDEVARFLGGVDNRSGSSMRRTSRPVTHPRESKSHGEMETPDPEVVAELHDEFVIEAASIRYRPVAIVDAQQKKQLRLRIEVPVEDMSRLSQPIEIPSGPAAQGPVRPSIWSAIHPRLLELIQQHRTTLLFVNSRRLAERLAGALNELAGKTVARSHHGSIARAQRIEIEDELKAGRLPALVATSSLELGIDMGAVDLVVQIEAPPSVASGMQRIGRGGHQVGAVSEGVIFPKFRGDLLACAAVVRAMHDGVVESTRYPRNPLDVLAQQIVAMVSMDEWDADTLLSTIRSAAPYAELRPRVFDSVLDMLSGRYPSDEFAELRPRLTWDRAHKKLTARENAKRVAVINGGTIPDRGLYGVFLLGADRGSARVGELDEEMVFESRVGETFLLGASTWRIEEITHDRVLVSPAPGEPGKMPFWRGDTASRPLELGRAIGKLVRDLRAVPPSAARATLVRDHDLDDRAAENLLQYLGEQASVTHEVPDDRTIVIERCRDELGDWRMCVLSPFGGRILAPWAMAVVARVREQTGLDVETMWTDDGFVVRFPEIDEAPDPLLMIPPAEEVEALVMRQLGATALFAGKFREVAARALLLPKRRPGGRTPLWQQRKRAADLLAVAARFGSFPALLETYRECLRDVFDMPALVSTLQQVQRRSIRIATVDSASPSPFAATLLFGYVANYIYDGDAPLAERRAQALSVDQAQLRELIGDAELRELLDASAIDEVERELQSIDERRRAKSVDTLHDLLLRIGDLSPDEVRARAVDQPTAAGVRHLVDTRRAIEVTIAGEARYIAVEDAARYRDALGIPMPAGIPESLLTPVRDPIGDLALRYARTHGPFTTAELAARYGLAPRAAAETLTRVSVGGRLVLGEFRPHGTMREWCDRDVLRTIRRRSLARLRHEVEPVDPAILGRFLTSWQGLTRQRRGPDALLDAVEQLQGAALPASILESEILPARVAAYQAADLDLLVSAGEVVWTGVEPLGIRDGRVALFLTDDLPMLARPGDRAGLGERAERVLDVLAERGASFFGAIHEAIGGGYPGETVDTLWDLVWRGLITNDTLQPLRAFVAPPDTKRRAARRGSQMFRSRRSAPPTAEGRWSLVETRLKGGRTQTEWSAALAQQLLTRYGVVTREAAMSENLPGGFSAVYPVLKAMEESGRIRRGYFVAGLGATQFAQPAAVDLLRSYREPPEQAEVVMMSATDPANPYGTVLPWPKNDRGLDSDDDPAAASPSAPTADAQTNPTMRPQRSSPALRIAGATVILVNGALAAYVGRSDRHLLTYLPDDEPLRSTVATAVASALYRLAAGGFEGRRTLFISDIDGARAADHPLAPFLAQNGFVLTALGFQAKRPPSAEAGARPTDASRAHVTV